MPFGEGWALFKTNDTQQSFCRQHGLSTEGLDRLPNKGGAWIIPGFSATANEQRDSSAKMKKLIKIFHEIINGSKDELNNAIYSVKVNSVVASPNTVHMLFKMSQICAAPR